MAVRETIGQWFDEGVAEGATHMIVKRDWFDGQTYPIFVKSAAEAREKGQRTYKADEDRVMEVYNLRKPKDPQINTDVLIFDYDEVAA